jgi:hypothetical protein
MTRFRSVAVACGLVATIGLGLVALTRAQPPGDGERPAASPRQKLRERLVGLRTEVELLKVEHEADRADLAKSLKRLRDLRRDGLPDNDRQQIMQVARMTYRAEINPGADVSARGRRVSLGEHLERYLAENRDKVKSLSAGQFVTLLLEEETNARAIPLVKSVEERKERFAHSARELHARELDLDEAERRYAETR